MTKKADTKGQIIGIQLSGNDDNITADMIANMLTPKVAFERIVELLVNMKLENPDAFSFDIKLISTKGTMLDANAFDIELTPHSAWKITIESPE